MWCLVTRIPAGLSVLPLTVNVCGALLATDVQSPAWCLHSAPQQFLTAFSTLICPGALVWLQLPSLPPVSFSPPYTLLIHYYQSDFYLFF